VVRYYLYKVPYLSAQVIPLAVLVGTLFTLTAMLRSHELIAMRAGGLSQWHVALPFLGTALAVSVAMIAFNEAVVPWANRRAAEIKRRDIRKQPAHDWRLASRAALWAPDGRLVYAGYVNGEEGVLTDVTVAEFHERTLLGRVDAASAVSSAAGWLLSEVQVYRSQGGALQRIRAARLRYDLGVEIADFFHEDRELKEQTMQELRANIRKLRMAGRDVRNEEVFYHLKWAFPFSSAIVALLALGISFTFQTHPREGRAAAFGVALIATGVYIGLVQFGQALGVGGVLSPVTAMWMANVIFTLAGAFLLWRSWRR
jgi:lipopolysaccharide export system permease protein